MRTADLAGIVVSASVLLIVIIIALALFVRHSAGINRRKYRAMQRMVNRTDQFANDIEDSIAALGDLEHPLAANVRAIVRAYRKEIRKL